MEATNNATKAYAGMEPYNIEYYIAKYGTVENLIKDYIGAIDGLRMQYSQYETNPRKGGRYRREKMEHLRQQAEAIYDELLRVSGAMKEYFAAQATETRQISTETAETVNVSAESENAEKTPVFSSREEVITYLDKTHGIEYDAGEVVYLKDGCCAEEHADGSEWCIYRNEDSAECVETVRIAPQSSETPQAGECIADNDYRVCSHCGKHFHEGYFLGDEYACSEECAVALYGGDRELFEADLEMEENEPGATECYWSVWQTSPNFKTFQ